MDFIGNSSDIKDYYRDFTHISFYLYVIYIKSQAKEKHPGCFFAPYDKLPGKLFLFSSLNSAYILIRLNDSFSRQFPAPTDSITILIRQFRTLLL